MIDYKLNISATLNCPSWMGSPGAPSCFCPVSFEGWCLQRIWGARAGLSGEATVNRGGLIARPNRADPRAGRPGGGAMTPQDCAGWLRLLLHFPFRYEEDHFPLTQLPTPAHGAVRSSILNPTSRQMERCEVTAHLACIFTPHPSRYRQRALVRRA